MPDGAVRSFVIVVSTPSLQLFGGIFKAHEPVNIQAFRPEPPIERLDKGVVGRFSRSCEVECDASLIGPASISCEMNSLPWPTRIVAG